MSSHFHVTIPCWQGHNNMVISWPFQLILKKLLLSINVTEKSIVDLWSWYLDNSMGSWWFHWYFSQLLKLPELTFLKTAAGVDRWWWCSGGTPAGRWCLRPETPVRVMIGNCDGGRWERLVVDERRNASDRWTNRSHDWVVVSERAWIATKLCFWQNKKLFSKNLVLSKYLVSCRCSFNVKWENCGVGSNHHLLIGII